MSYRGKTAVATYRTMLFDYAAAVAGAVAAGMLLACSVGFSLATDNPYGLVLLVVAAVAVPLFAAEVRTTYRKLTGEYDG